MKSIVAVIGMTIALGAFLPAVLHSQDPITVPSTSSGVAAGNPFVNLRQPKIEASYSVPNKFAESAATLRDLEEVGKAAMREMDFEGFLSSRLQISSNSFKSTVTGDVIYNIQVSLMRPCAVLGTTEVTEAAVWSQGSVGRCDESSAKSEMLDALRKVLQNFDQQLRHSRPTTEPGPEVL